MRREYAQLYSSWPHAECSFLQSLTSPKSLSKVWLPSWGQHLTSDLLPEPDHPRQPHRCACFPYPDPQFHSPSYFTHIAGVPSKSYLVKLYFAICANPIGNWWLLLQITHFINICGTQLHAAPCTIPDVHQTFLKSEIKVLVKLRKHGQSPVQLFLLHIPNFTIQISANLSSSVPVMQREATGLGNRSILISLLVSTKEWMGL